MKDIKNNLKKDFNYIDLSDESKNNILNNIYCNYNKYKKRRNIILSFSLVLFICLIGFGVSYADEIVDYFKVKEVTCKNGVTSTIGQAKDIRKVINYDANIPELTPDDENIVYKYSEIEKLLNTKLVKSTFEPSETLNLYNCQKESNKIAALNFRVPRDNNRRYNMYISLITKYYKGESTIEWNTKNNLMSNGFLIKNLNTKAYILQFRGEEWTSSTYQITFIYDNVLYWVVYSPRTIDKEERKEQIMNFLDSLYV